MLCDKCLDLVCILLNISPASDCGLPTFWNTLSVPSSKAGYEVWSNFILHIQPLKMEQIECSETSANHNRTSGKYPKEYRQDPKHGESLKSRNIWISTFHPQNVMWHIVSLLVRLCTYNADFNINGNARWRKLGRPSLGPWSACRAEFLLLTGYAARPDDSAKHRSVRHLVMATNRMAWHSITSLRTELPPQQNMSETVGSVGNVELGRHYQYRVTDFSWFS